MPRTTKRGLPRREGERLSLGAQLLESLGGLIMGIGAVAALAYAWQSIGTELFWTFGLPTTLGFGSGTVFLGRLIMVAARRRPSARWRLWAQILTHLGAILSFSVPVFVYGVLFFGDQIAAMNDTPPPFEIGPINSWRLSVTVMLSGIPFLIGLCLIIPALVWGRLKPVPDVPAVFS